MILFFVNILRDCCFSILDSYSYALDLHCSSPDAKVSFFTDIMMLSKDWSSRHRLFSGLPRGPCAVS